MSPGCQLGSWGHVVAQRCRMCGEICHQAKLDLGSTVNRIWAGRGRAPSHTADSKRIGKTWTRRTGRVLICDMPNSLPGYEALMTLAKVNSRLQVGRDAGKPVKDCPCRPLPARNDLRWQRVLQ